MSPAVILPIAFAACVLVTLAASFDLDWVACIEGSEFVGRTKLVSDKTGDVYVSGTFISQTLTFKHQNESMKMATYVKTTGVNFEPFGDAFVGKYSKDGVPLWVAKIIGDAPQIVWKDASPSMALSDEALYVVGESPSPQVKIYDRDQTLVRTLTSTGYAIKYTLDGRMTWVLAIPNVQRVSLGDAQSVYFSGLVTEGSVTFPLTIGSDSYSPVLTNSEGNIAYISKYTSTGIFVWSICIMFKDEGEIPPVKSDSDGNIYVGGWTTTTNPANIVDTRGNVIGKVTNGFLVKFNSNGSLMWSIESFNQMAWLHGINLDRFGNVLIYGTTPFSIKQNSLIITAPSVLSDTDAYLAKFNGTNGKYLFTVMIASDLGDRPFGAFSNDDGSILFSAKTDGASFPIHANRTISSFQRTPGYVLADFSASGEAIGVINTYPPIRFTDGEGYFFGVNELAETSAVIEPGNRSVSQAAKCLYLARFKKREAASSTERTSSIMQVPEETFTMSTASISSELHTRHTMLSSTFTSSKTSTSVSPTNTTDPSQLPYEDQTVFGVRYSTFMSLVFGLLVAPLSTVLAVISVIIIRRNRARKRAEKKQLDATYFQSSTILSSASHSYQTQGSVTLADSMASFNLFSQLSSLQNRSPISTSESYWNKHSRK